MKSKTTDLIGVALISVGVGAAITSVIGYRLEKRHDEIEKKLKQSHKVAWTALKDMLEPDADDAMRRLEIAKRAVLHDNFNRVVSDL